MKCLLIAAAFGFTSLMSSYGATNNFSVPFFRGLPNSETGYWENFSIGSGEPGNAPDRAGSTSDALLVQNDSNAILTSTFNIYNPAGQSDFTLSDSSPFVLGTAVLQARTLGAELDYASAVLTYTNEAGPQSIAPVYRLERDRGTALGASVSVLWQWGLSGLAITNYSISFKAAGSSLSFDAMTLDTWDRYAKIVPEIFYSSTEPAIERWMYPFNAAPCDRPAASVFGTLSDATGVDSRHAQHVLGWDTGESIPTGRGPTNYLVRSCRITLTINRGNLFLYDPTHDSYRTCLETNNPAFLADEDAGRPVELFGVGYRNGFTAATFDQCAPFGSSAAGGRNAFTVSWDADGALVDVSNNAGKTNENFSAFEAWPFATGRTTEVEPGEPVPAGAKLSFDLNLNDPFVLAYLQRGLNEGRIRFAVSSFHSSNSGQPAFPDFVTHFSETTVDPTRIELIVAAVRENDSDSDGLPDDWEEFYIGQLNASANEDSDGDGLPNAVELDAGTNPKAAASVLRLASVVENGSTVKLRWAHAANREYSMESSEDFHAWAPVSGFAPQYLEPGIAEWTVNGEGSKRFYRIRID